MSLCTPFFWNLKIKYKLKEFITKGSLNLETFCERNSGNPFFGLLNLIMFFKITITLRQQLISLISKLQTFDNWKRNSNRVSLLRGRVLALPEFFRGRGKLRIQFVDGFLDNVFHCNFFSVMLFAYLFL